MTPDDLPALGSGLGYRAAFRAELFLNRDQIDWLEIITDHFLDGGPESEEELSLLADHFPLIPHGLDLSLGSAEGLDSDYTDRTLALVNQLRPPWWSDHLAFTRAGGVSIGHLSPVPFTSEALAALCRNIAAVQAGTEIPLVLENISYLVPPSESEMTEAQFLAEVAGRTGCGLLLDVTNIYANCRNNQRSIERFLDDLPLERVVQCHYVGGVWQDGVFIDSHSEPTPEPVWELMAEVIARAPVRAVLLERDENLPAFSDLTAEVARARELGRRVQRWG